MKVARNPEEAGFFEKSVVTIGSFDGMHLGHRAILNEVLEKSRAIPGRSVVITFSPHPRMVLGSGSVKLLSTLDERLDLFRGVGVDIAMVLDFTYGFSRMPATEFYNQYILRGTGVSEVVVGDDHSFGRDREASIDTLRELGSTEGFGVTTIGPVSVEGTRISSSMIRSLLADGDVSRAASFLGRPYGLMGTVVRGDGRGTSIGFPTANLTPVSPEKIIPGRGVYLVEADVRGAVRHGMMNIGTRPTFVEGGMEVIELHLFDWTEQITGEDVGIRFLRYIREEKKFSNAAEIASQLEKDRDECLRHIQSVH